jgi:hypothetical protein
VLPGTVIVSDVVQQHSNSMDATVYVSAVFDDPKLTPQSSTVVGAAAAMQGACDAEAMATTTSGTDWQVTACGQLRVSAVTLDSELGAPLPEDSGCPDGPNCGALIGCIVVLVLLVCGVLGVALVRCRRRAGALGRSSSKIGAAGNDGMMLAGDFDPSDTIDAEIEQVNPVPTAVATLITPRGVERTSSSTVAAAVVISRESSKVDEDGAEGLRASLKKQTSKP